MPGEPREKGFKLNCMEGGLDIFEVVLDLANFHLLDGAGEDPLGGKNCHLLDLAGDHLDGVAEEVVEEEDEERCKGLGAFQSCG